jgi:FkbM family methyltransferase
VIGQVATAFFGRLPPQAQARLRRSSMARTLIRPLDRKARQAQHTVGYGPARGIRIITDPAPPQLATGRYELAVQEALVRLLKPGMVVYDIGANVGFFTLLTDRLVSPGGTVIAFEPDPVNLAALRRNLALNPVRRQIRIIAAAASSRTGPGSFESETSMTGRVETKGTVPIELIRIDDFTAEYPHLAPDLVKIDVEGHELDVLAGMAKTLREHSPIAIIEGHQTRPEVEAALHAFDYRVTALGEELERGRHVLAERNHPTLAIG